MNNQIKISALLLVGMLFMNSCKDENNEPEPDTNDAFKGKVLVLNEGGFLKGNASVDVYDKVAGTLKENVFETTNNRPLGDVLQSIVEENNKLYLVVNNSGKIEVTDKALKGLATITGFTSPRYMAVYNGKGYVTDLFSGKIWVADLSANQITDSIAAPGWSEGIVVVDGQIWVARPSNNYIYRINPDNRTLSDSIQIPSGASELVADGKGNVWVLCGGLESNNIKASLTRIRISDKSTGINLDFDGQYPSKLRYRNGKLYFVVGGSVHRIEEEATAVGAAWLSNASAYGLGIDPETDDVWVANAKDFTGKSEVNIYKADGSKLKTFETGVANNGFYWLD